MKIDKYIQQQAPKHNDGDPHDMAYAEALRGAHAVYKDMNLTDLKKWQVVARKHYDATHNMTAACMILYELISEKIDR